MTTPQFKFFDKSKNIFPENQDEYFIRNDGLIFKLYSDALFNVQLIWCENIIAVPFTGKFDKNKNPIYKHDLLKTCYEEERDNHYGEIIWRNDELVCGFSCDGWRLSVDMWEAMEIIDSALTNQELLEDKE